MTEDFPTEPTGPTFALLVDGRVVRESLYRNAGHAVAIVAVGPDATGQWAAYIGPARDRHESEEATMAHVARQGVKLEATEACRMVKPELVAFLGGLERYRD